MDGRTFSQNPRKRRKATTNSIYRFQRSLLQLKKKKCFEVVAVKTRGSLVAGKLILSTVLVAVDAKVSLQRVLLAAANVHFRATKYMQLQFSNGGSDCRSRGFPQHSRLVSLVLTSRPQGLRGFNPRGFGTVSYTHLTLPTITKV